MQCEMMMMMTDDENNRWWCDDGIIIIDDNGSGVKCEMVMTKWQKNKGGNETEKVKTKGATRDGERSEWVDSSRFWSRF